MECRPVKTLSAQPELHSWAWMWRAECSGIHRSMFLKRGRGVLFFPNRARISLQWPKTRSSLLFPAVMLRMLSRKQKTKHPSLISNPSQPKFGRPEEHSTWSVFCCALIKCGLIHSGTTRDGHLPVNELFTAVLFSTAEFRIKQGPSKTTIAEAQTEEQIMCWSPESSMPSSLLFPEERKQPCMLSTNLPYLGKAQNPKPDPRRTQVHMHMST